jgi:hypothetical protein
MTESTQRGLFLLAGCVLTLIWVFLCPGYTVQGQIDTPSTYRTPSDHGGWSTKDHAHVDVGEMIAGLVIIWSGLGALFYLLPAIRRASAASVAAERARSLPKPPPKPPIQHEPDGP